MIVRETLVVGYWDFIPMESGAELLAQQDIATVRVVEERWASNKQRNCCLTEDNWSRLKEALVDSRYPYLRGQCDESCLELGLDTVPKKTIFHFLQRVGRKPITYENAFPMKKRSFLSENQVNYVECIIVKRCTANLRMSRKEVIQVIS